MTGAPTLDTAKKPLKGVEDFLKANAIKGEAADIIRAWARESMYWNGLVIMDPQDIAVVVMGAQSHGEMEDQFIERIERRLGL